MWTGRFSQTTADRVLRYSESVSYDWRLYKQDIAGSVAHARAQMNAGLLTQKEFAEIEQGLRAIQEDIEAGKFHWDTKLEDVHMNIENELTRRIGPAGAKLHTARSRNDQVATDSRLYCRKMLDEVRQALVILQKVLVQKAGQYATVRIPGYTHLQRAQPVTVAHHLLAYVEMLQRDSERLLDCRKRVNVCPLGSGAIAGSTINLDRESLSEELGFDSITQNSMDAIADRDYVAESLFCLALIGTHLSRLSEDVILWSSAEFGFCTLADAHTTGSSLMPQKKNPDVCELTRGKTGRLYGNLTAVLVVLKGLPLTYNRDLQEDKEPLFDSFDTVLQALSVNAEMIDAMQINEAQCTSAVADPLLLATDLADYLVRRGVPFRQAHECVGKAVAMAEKEHCLLSDLSPTQLRLISPRFGDDVAEVFNLDRAFTLRTNAGSPNAQRTAERLRYWHNLLDR